LFDAALCAVSNKVDNYKDEESAETQSERVQNALNQVMPGKVRYVETWTDWKEQINTDRPSLLVLMPHTVTNEDYDLPEMTIGADDPLLVTHVLRPYVQSGDEAPAPVVLLMGCATMLAGEADIPFQSLVGRFRQNGAAIVVSTRTKIRSRHSIPVFEEVIAILDQVIKDAGHAHSFGDVMLTLRQRALAEGLPMVLTLFAFGDADWLLAE
jgi:hypothetical protein